MLIFGIVVLVIGIWLLVEIKNAPTIEDWEDEDRDESN